MTDNLREKQRSYKMSDLFMLFRFFNNFLHLDTNKNTMTKNVTYVPNNSIE